jgi:hypothetical protein
VTATLLHAGHGKVEDGGLDPANRLALSNKPVDFSESLLLDPSLPTRCADLGRGVLKKVKVSAAPLFVGNSGWAQLPATDGAALAAGLSS